MEFINIIKKAVAFTFLALILSACDGGGGIAPTDTTAPNAPISNNINIAATSGLMTVSGTAEPGSKVTITFPDGTKAYGNTDANGNFSITSNTAQNNGIIKITSEDANGNISNTTIVDTNDSIAPSFPVSINFTSNSNGTITVTGAAEPNTTVTAVFPDGSQQSVVADNNGIINFSLTSLVSQPSGEIHIFSTDAVGNKSRDAIIDAKVITKSLYLATGVLPDLSFKPSLGINTEAPQGGADTAGMPSLLWIYLEQRVRLKNFRLLAQRLTLMAGLPVLQSVKPTQNQNSFKVLWITLFLKGNIVSYMMATDD